MAFSTISTYLDPANWQQQLSYGSSTVSTGQIPPPPPPPPPPPHGAGGLGSIRPGSMADRAGMANVPMPETALKCPRCESTNTKFCYFNNYSLSQPRHFCKTCRRYWTKGGALRSVPVGGGCRRNKRSGKAAAAATSTTTPNSKSSVNSETGGGASANSNSTTNTNSDIAQPPYMPPLRHYAETMNYGAPVGTTTSEMNHDVPTGSNLFGGTGGALLLSGGAEAWRMMQQGQGQQHYVPPNFLGGFDLTAPQGGGGGMFNYSNYYGGSSGGGTNTNNTNYYVGAKMLNSSGLSQALVKMEMSKNNNQDCETNLGMGTVDGGYSTNAAASAWKEISGFNSSSTSNH